MWSPARPGVREIAGERELQEAFARCAVSLLAGAPPDQAGIDYVLETVAKLRLDNATDPHLLADVLHAGARDYFELRGRRLHLPYDVVARLSDGLAAWLCARVGAEDGHRRTAPATTDLDAWRTLHLEHVVCAEQPFAGCSEVCPEARCMLRFNVEPLLGDERLHENFVAALGAGETMWDKARAVARIAVRRAVAPGVAPEHRRTAGLCYVVQKGETMAYLDPHLRATLVTNLARRWEDGEGDQ